ncbi:hypothetical protein [Streptomyces sp. NPDC051001]|uniref:hypothetical protein n=1 Tax=Streptomyces sp. NPDC051001 TaxID=3155795 RepID=UPI00343DA137
MRRRDTTEHRRCLSAVGLTVGLALAVAGCSDSGSSTLPDRAAAATPQGGDSLPRSQQERTAAAQAELAGRNGLILAITAAERDRAASYLTVRGTLTNNGPKTTALPAELRGNETDVLRSGSSLAGTTVVDFKTRKRYYVLRDTDHRPLTTTGLSTLEPGENARAFMQFPAPPPSTSTVGFHLPLFDTANITIAPGAPRSADSARAGSGTGSSGLALRTEAALAPPKIFDIGSDPVDITQLISDQDGAERQQAPEKEEQ